jgi:hypothetical protein
MRLNTWQTLLAAGVYGSLLLGCNHAPVNQPPRDPLFTSKKWVVGKTDKTAPAQVAKSEPAAPAVPETALASAPVNPDTLGSPSIERAGGQVATVAPDNAPKPPLQAIPTARSGASAEVQAEPASRQAVAGIYGHAPDHTWLQGVLDKHYLGQMHLRYCDPTMDETWGGKVILEKDDRLAPFKDGDVVRVEGELVKEDGQAKRGSWCHFPLYRIRDIQLIQSKH